MRSLRLATTPPTSRYATSSREGEGGEGGGENDEGGKKGEGEGGATGEGEGEGGEGGEGGGEYENNAPRDFASPGGPSRFCKWRRWRRR